jgi:hypothetical protein
VALQTTGDSCLKGSGFDPSSEAGVTDTRNEALNMAQLPNLQKSVDSEADQNVLGGIMEPQMIAEFCLVASWSMAIGSYAKLFKHLLHKHKGYLCKVISSFHSQLVLVIVTILAGPTCSLVCLTSCLGDGVGHG